MGTFIELIGLGLVIAFVWVVCGPWWGILALAIVLIILGNAIDKGTPHDDPAKPGGKPEGIPGER